MKNKQLGFLASDGTVKSWGDVKQRLFKGSVQNYFTRSMTAENLNHGAQMLLLFQSWFFFLVFGSVFADQSDRSDCCVYF